MFDLIELAAIAAEKNGILDLIPESVYHAFPAMSASGLKEFRKGPGYWKWMRENPSADTQARLEGRLVHMAILEPERFARSVIAIDGNRNSNDVKAAITSAKAKGLTVCKSEDMETTKRIAEFCRAHPLIKEILSSGSGERTMLWRDPATGVQCKARADWITASGVIVDLKTFGPIHSDDEIERQCRKMSYHFQSAWYLDGYLQCTGTPSKGFYHVFIRNEDPLDARVVEIDPQSLDEARPYIGQWMRSYAECLRLGQWPMSPPEVTGIVLKPFWS